MLEPRPQEVALPLPVVVYLTGPQLCMGGRGSPEVRSCSASWKARLYFMFYTVLYYSRMKTLFSGHPHHTETGLYTCPCRASPNTFAPQYMSPSCTAGSQRCSPSSADLSHPGPPSAAGDSGDLAQLSTSVSRESFG